MKRTDPKTKALVADDPALLTRFRKAHDAVCGYEPGLVSMGEQYDQGGVTAEEFFCGWCRAKVLALTEADGHVTWVFHPCHAMRVAAGRRADGLK